MKEQVFQALKARERKMEGGGESNDTRGLEWKAVGRKREREGTLLVRKLFQYS